MTTTTQKVLAAVVGIGALLGVLAFLGVHFGGQTFGSINNGAQVQNYPYWFTNGLYSGASQQFSVSSTGAVTSGNLTITTSDTATSTANVGCVQTTATSTATPIRLLYVASTTAKAISGTQSGYVLWGYGTCPF